MPIQRCFVQLVLRGFSSIRVDEVVDAQRAAALVDDARYDAVVMDNDLPLGGGQVVLERMREERSPNQQTQAIVVTEAVTSDMLATAEILGNVEFMAKPVSAARLWDGLGAALGLRAASFPAAAEARRTPRLSIPVNVWLADGESKMRLVTSNISPHGAFLATSHIKPVGSRAHLSIDLPHLAEPLEISCEVVHARPEPCGQRPAGFGVRFEARRPEDLNRLVRAFMWPSA